MPSPRGRHKVSSRVAPVDQGSVYTLYLEQLRIYFGGDAVFSLARIPEYRREITGKLLISHSKSSKLQRGELKVFQGICIAEGTVLTRDHHRKTLLGDSPQLRSRWAYLVRITSP